VNEETIELFLREYGKTHSLKETTYHRYKEILRRFMKFVTSRANYQ